MKKLFTLILLTLISISCTDNDTVDVGSEIIPDRNVYVAGYIIDASGNMMGTKQSGLLELRFTNLARI